MEHHNVISLVGHRQRSERYAKALRETRGAIEELREELFSKAVDLATAGPWSEWSDAQPVGAVATFSWQGLAHTGDPNLTALARADAALASLQEELY